MRPRAFDEEVLLEQAFALFWRRGIRTTSLAEIAQATGVQRGSLYNAYGDKESLFLAAHRRYADGYLAAVGKVMSSGSLRQRLEGFCDVSITNFCAGKPSRSCPTTRGLMEVAPNNREGLSDRSAAAFSVLLRQILERVEGAFRDGAQRGEFSGDAALAAGQLVAMVRGLVILERTLFHEPQLREIATHTIDTILAGSGS
ncbi:MAG: TetR/AcrR family transcriptional regulator [Pseudomonadota bacterium]